MREFAVYLSMVSSIVMLAKDTLKPASPIAAVEAISVGSDSPDAIGFPPRAEPDATASIVPERADAAVVSSDTDQLHVATRTIADALPTPTLAEQMLAENNRIRAAAIPPKPPQTLDPRLTQAAEDHVKFLVRTGQYSHYVNGDSRQGNPRTRARQHGFPATDSAYSVSENLTVNCQTMDEAFVDWRKSDPHYKAIVGDFDLAGFAMAEGGPWPYHNIWCAVYGKESPATAPKLVSATPVRSAPPAQFQQCQPGMPCYRPAQQPANRSPGVRYQYQPQPQSFRPIRRFLGR